MTISNNTDYETIKRALLTWSDGILGSDKTRWGNMDFPRFSRPYGTFEIVQMGEDQGIDETVEELNGGVIETTYFGARAMVLQYRIYTATPAGFSGTFPRTLMRAAIVDLHAQSRIDAFREAAIAYINHTAIRQENEFRGEKWEWIAACELNINYRTVLFDDGLGTPPDDGQYIAETDVTINSEPTLDIP